MRKTTTATALLVYIASLSVHANTTPNENCYTHEAVGTATLCPIKNVEEKPVDENLISEWVMVKLLPGEEFTPGVYERVGDYVVKIENEKMLAGFDC
jgi:hypothetical protein